MDDLYYKQVFSLLLFPNRNNEKLADYLSVTNQFIWRRDSHRLVAFHLENKTDDWDYSIEELKDLNDVVNLKIDDKGILSFITKETVNTLSPVEKVFDSNSLQTLFEKNHQTEFEIPGKELSRQLSILQRKVSSSSLEIENTTIVLDLKNKTISLKELNEKKSISISLKKGNDLTISYSFAYFRDLLINSNKFDEMILFKCHLPYFTAIRYDKNLYAVLTHKKD